jgi:hypothetical protein
MILRDTCDRYSAYRRHARARTPICLTPVTSVTLRFAGSGVITRVGSAARRPPLIPDRGSVHELRNFIGQPGDEV